MLTGSLRQTDVIDVNRFKKANASKCILVLQTPLQHILTIARKRNIPKRITCQHLNKNRTIFIISARAF